MARTSLGTYYVQIQPSADGLAAAIDKAMNGDDAGSKFGAGFLDSFKNIALGSALGNLISSGVQAAMAGAKEVFTQSFQGFADFQQNVGGVQKLYGNMGMSVEEYAKSVGKSVADAQGDWTKLETAQNTVLKNAQNAYKTTGMSANQYMETATSFSAALINSLGGDTEAAAAQTQVAMQAISDNWNTFGGDMDLVTQAYQGFAKQNYTMLDNLKLGYGGTKTEMERLIADANEWGKANGGASDLSIDSFSDVVTAIQQIQEKQQIAGTTAREAQTTISGSMTMLSASWSNFLTELANGEGDINARMQELTESLGIVIENVVPVVVQMAVAAIQAIPGILTEAFGVVGETLFPLIDEMTGGAATKFLEAVEPIVAPFRDQILPVISNAIGAMMEVMSGAAPVISNILGGAMQILTGLAEALGWAFDTLSPAISFVAELFGGALMLALDLVSGLFTTLGDVITAIGDVVAPIAEAITQAFQDVADKISPIIDGIGGLIGGIGDFLSDPIGAIANFGKESTDTLKDVQSSTKDASKSYQDMSKNTKKATTEMSNQVKSDLVRSSKTMTTETKSMESTAKKSFNNINSSVKDSMGKAATETANKTRDMQNSINSVQGKDIKLTATDGVTGIVTTAKNALAEIKNKNVDLTANDKTAGAVATAKKGIESVKGKTVDINLNVKQTGIKELTVEQSFSGATGQTRYTVQRTLVATGGILTRATDVTAGEDGTEAIIPLSNRRYVKPFAQAVASEIDTGGTVYEQESARLLAYYLPAILKTIPDMTGRDFDRLARRAVA